MNKYYFTFGIGHLFKNKYLELQAKNEDEARLRMIDCFGRNQDGYPNFCSVYTEESWNQLKLAQKYGWTKLNY